MIIYFQVSIGAGQNRYSLIQNLDDPSEETRAETPNILQCEAVKYIWVYWMDDQILVGGGESFTEPFITHTMPEKRNLNFVSLSSGEQVSASFLMAKYNRK